MSGFSESEIPYPLRAVPKPPDYERRCSASWIPARPRSRWTRRTAMGFAQKDASDLAMALYNLMPAGSVIIVPSSMWTSALWAAQLGSAALRGCHVYIIAPSAKNASAGSKYLLSRQSEIFARLIQMSEILGPEIAQAGGALHIGLYDRKIGLADVSGSLRHVARAYRAQPFLRAEFPFPAPLYDFLNAAADSLNARELAGQQIIGDVAKRDPLLHRKTQFFATRATLEAIAADSGIVGLFRRWIVNAVDQQTLAQTSVPTWSRPERRLVTPLLHAFDALPDSLRARAALQRRGLDNKDARGVYLDGEVYVLLAGPEALGTVAGLLHDVRVVHVGCGRSPKWTA